MLGAVLKWDRDQCIDTMNAGAALVISSIGGCCCRNAEGQNQRIMHEHCSKMIFTLHPDQHLLALHFFCT